MASMNVINLEPGSMNAWRSKWLHGSAPICLCHNERGGPRTASSDIRSRPSGWHYISEYVILPEGSFFQMYIT